MNAGPLTVSTASSLGRGDVVVANDEELLVAIDELLRMSPTSEVRIRAVTMIDVDAAARWLRERQDEAFVAVELFALEVMTAAEAELLTRRHAADAHRRALEQTLAKWRKAAKR